jgi:hypothetical protein
MSTSIIYQIKIKEQLGDQWVEWFFPLVIHNEPDGATVLIGPLRDQGELHGMLSKVRDLNLTLLAVNRLEGS